MSFIKYFYIPNLPLSPHTVWFTLINQISLLSDSFFSQFSFSSHSRFVVGRLIVGLCDADLSLIYSYVGNGYCLSSMSDNLSLYSFDRRRWFLTHRGRYGGGRESRSGHVAAINTLELDFSATDHGGRSGLRWAWYLFLAFYIWIFGQKTICLYFTSFLPFPFLFLVIDAFCFFILDLEQKFKLWRRAMKELRSDTNELGIMMVTADYI